MKRKHKVIWDDILSFLQNIIPEQSFKTWFTPIVPLKIEDKTLTIQVPSQFFYDWLEEHYASLIRQALVGAIGDDARLVYSVALNDRNQLLTLLPSTDPRRFSSRGVDSQSQLNPRYCFENFIEGDGNSFAKAASLAVAEAPGKTPFNPLVIYGGIGLGKTHLIQAIGNFALYSTKKRVVRYISSEKFTFDFIDSVKNFKTTDFSNFYRNVDLLLVDDIQFFAKKEGTQMEFFHTFNTLYQKGKQIVLTSDRPPKDLDGLDERLISRFQWGLITDIQPPDLETRIAILEKKAEADGIVLPPEITHFIASHITTNIRELEGALIKLLAHSSLTGTDITLEVAKQVLKDFTRIQKSDLSVEKIQSITADFFNIPDDLLRAKTRKKEVATARHVAMYLATKLTPNSLKTIGLHFGGRDHSTVIHATHTVENQIGRDTKFRDTVDTLKRKIEIQAL